MHSQAAFLKKCSLQLSQFIFLAFIFLYSQNAPAHLWEFAENKPIASCLVTDKSGAIMMVKSYITGKYHLPGGAIEKGEKPEDTALKHMIEDTGFNAHVGYTIDQIGGHTIFACSLLTPREFYISPQNKKIVVAWANLLSSRDVGQPVLMPNSEETFTQYARYAETNRFDDWIQRNVPSRFVLIQSGLDIAPKFYQTQHNWLVQVRDWALSYDSVAVVAKAFPAASAFIFPLLFIISLPFFRAYYGFRALLIYSTGLVYLGLLCVVLNAHLPVAPPFFFDHSFIPTGTVYFSFPTNEVTFFAFVFSWLIIRWPSKKFIQEKIFVGMLGMFFVSISAIKTAVYGESYPLVIVASFLVAILSSYVLRYVRKIRLSDRTRALVSTRFWVYSTFLTFIIGAMSDSMRVNYIGAFCFGVALSLVLLKVTPNYVRSLRSEIRLPFFILSVVGLMVVFFVAVNFVPEKADKDDIFYFNMFSMLVVPIWLFLIMPRLFKQYFVKRLAKAE